jgi:hypothetical protein
MPNHDGHISHGSYISYDHINPAVKEARVYYDKSSNKFCLFEVYDKDVAMAELKLKQCGEAIIAFTRRYKNKDDYNVEFHRNDEWSLRKEESLQRALEMNTDKFIYNMLLLLI